MPEKRKLLLNTSEVIFWAIMIPIVFYGWTRLLCYPSLEESFLPDKFFEFWVPCVIVGLNVLWIIGIYLLPFKNLRIKVDTTLLFLTISAATLYVWFWVNALGGAMH